MNLSERLAEKCIVIDPDVQDKKSLLKVIAENAKTDKTLKKISADEIHSRLVKREELGSTGFGNGIAIPHCSVEGISDFVIGIVVVKRGIDFHSLDGKKVKVLVFIIAPADKRNEHIHYLSAISSVLKNSAAVEEMVRCENEPALRESFLRYLPGVVEKEREKELNLLHIFVQAEEKFEDVITILMEVNNISISVIEADNADKYLHHLPLFTSFWGDNRRDFQKLILAAIEKSYTNDVIRKINMLINSLPDKKGILVLMQNIEYFSGSLEL